MLHNIIYLIIIFITASINISLEALNLIQKEYIGIAFP
jgi:hypothetical protein